MNLSELRYTLAVAQERNFRRAAERCFISQPALSTAIQKLEEELGVQIFERSRTEVSLTTVGQRIVEQAQRVMEEAERIRSIAREGRDQLIGPLRLGLIHTIGPYVLPDLIPALHARAPEMPLEVEENTTSQLELSLKNGAVDLVVVALPFESPGIDLLPLYDEKFEVVKAGLDLLVTPLVTVVSGGPKTPHEQRAVQIAVAKALREWVNPSP